MLLKQSTARNLSVLMTDSADHVTGKIGLTLTITASKDGAAFASITPTVTELATGWYSLALTTTHTNTLGDLALHITGTGADPTDLVRQVVADLPGASVASVSGAVGSVTGNVGGNVVGTVASVVGAVASVTGNVGGNVVGTVASVVGAVGSVTGNVGGNVVGSVASVTARVSANADQLAGQTVTAAAGVTFPTSVASPTNITAGTITTATNLTNAPTAGDFTAAMKTSLNAATPAVTVSDKTGFALTAAYDAAKTAAQAGNAMTLTSAYDAAKTASQLDAAGVRTALGLALANLDTQLAALDTDILSRSTYAGGDTAGTTTLLARLTSTRAGLLDNLDTAVSTRLAASGYTVPDNTTIGTTGTAVAAIKAKTDNLPASPADETLVIAAANALAALLGTPVASLAADLAAAKVVADAIAAKTTNLPASPAAVSDIPTAAQNADKLLGRSLAGSADGGRTVQDALRALRNKTSIAAGTLTVTAEDDTTAAWTAAVTTAAGDPITVIDPA